MDYVEFGDVYLFHQRKNLQNQTIFERTSKKVSFPLMLSQEPGFAGLLQSKLHQIIYFIILQNEEGFYKKKGVCYCSICHDIRSANGGNYSHHAKRHEEEDPQLSREDEIEMLLVWAVSHNIPFSAFHDSKWRTVFHGWIAKEAHWDILNKFAEKIHELISSELEKAEFIEMSTDGWSCNHGRFQGIIAHTSGPEGATYPLAFLPSDTEIMGKEKIAELVLKTMNMFDINRQKVVGIVTDTTAENPAAAQLLELQWDPCYLHILSLAMQDFYPALPVPFKECLNSLSILAATAKFKDFKRAHIDEYPEISEKWRIQKGVPTRWCSYIKEMKSLLERMKIQWGTSMCYPLSSMSCHVSACPHPWAGRTTPLKTRGAVASLGAFGYELDLTKLSDEEKETVKTQIREYKEIDELVLRSDLYRLLSPFDSDYFCQLLVSKDRTRAYAVGMCLRGGPYTVRTVRLRGLDENKTYTVRELKCTVSGKALMQIGLPLSAMGDYDAWTWHIEEKSI